MKVAKISLRLLLMVLSCMMIYWYVISRLVTIGSVAGTLFFTWVGVNSILWDKIAALVQKIKKHRVGNILYRILCVLAALMFVWIVVILGAMAYFAGRPADENATVVVLGCQVRGTSPSLMLRKRIDAAYEYLVSHPDAQCIVSGGQGSGEMISEAQCMYDNLVSMGIAKERIYREDRSTNTSENLRFSADMIQKNGLNPQMAIVTDGFHEMRAAILAGRLGYECGAVPARTPTYLSANFTTREVLAVTASLLLNR